VVSSGQRDRRAAVGIAKRDQEKRDRLIYCSHDSCGAAFDPALIKNRKGDHDICTACYKRSQSALRNRLRDFKDRLFTTLVFDEADLHAVLQLLDDPCTFCGSTENITIEHLTPLIKGGTNVKENLAAACKSCNSRKQDRTEAEFRFILAEQS
jgi:5-methylcytosine-specific restriction endonuclease McrA